MSFIKPGKSEAVFGDFAKHWHLGLGLAIIASVAFLPRGLVDLPAQLRKHLLGGGPLGRQAVGGGEEL